MRGQVMTAINKKLLYLFLLLSFILFNAGYPQTEKEPYHTTLPEENTELLNYDKNLRETIKARKLEKEKISILIEKSEYRLTVYCDMKPVKSYPVVFGFNPVDDKLMQGDGCTPEGIFKIRDQYPSKYWNYFIWIDYPTDDSRRKHNLAKKSGEIPDNVSIGGEIGIHGVPEGNDDLIKRRRNWTLGCISLKNDDVAEIYKFCKPGNVVEILH